MVAMEYLCTLDAEDRWTKRCCRVAKVPLSDAATTATSSFTTTVTRAWHKTSASIKSLINIHSFLILLLLAPCRSSSHIWSVGSGPKIVWVWYRFFRNMTSDSSKRRIKSLVETYTAASRVCAWALRIMSCFRRYVLRTSNLRHLDEMLYTRRE